MTEVPDLNGAEGKRIFDKAQLMLFFLYLNALCAGDSFYFAKEESVHHELVQKVNEYIEAHMSETILLEELAEYVHMSKYYFLRRFKELTGLTVHSYLNNKRLIRACEELKKGIPDVYKRQVHGIEQGGKFARIAEIIHAVKALSLIHI